MLVVVESCGVWYWGETMDDANGVTAGGSYWLAKNVAGLGRRRKALKDEGVRRGIMEDGGPSVGAASGNRRLRIYCKWRIVTGRRQSKGVGVGLRSFYGNINCELILV
jgi:hypothetical protein